MLKIYFKTTKNRRLAKIKKVTGGSWVNISEAAQEDLEEVVKLTDLTLLDLRDTLDIQELPRIERHRYSLMIFVRIPTERMDNSSFIHTTPLTCIITDKYFITISPVKNHILKDIQKSSLPIATTQRSKLLVYLLLKISQSFTSQVKLISHQVASKKKRIENIKDSDIGELIKYEDILNQYTSALIPMRNVFENLVEAGYLKFYQEDQELFDDAVISMRQSVDICQVNLKSIKSLRESYQIVFTNRLNKVIQFLTAFTIIMTIPTIIASLYGMNVSLPMAGNPFAFVYVLLISLGIIILFFILFYKKRWL